MGNLGNLSPQGSVAVGIIVGLISTSLQAIGLTLQRKSHLLEDDKPLYDLRRPPYKRRRWQLGMTMFVISNIVGSTIQITTLPLPVLSTLQASGLVFNTIFATLILGEPFTRYSFAGTFLVCIGAILIAIFGAIGEPAHTLNQLLRLLRGQKFLIWMLATLVLVVFILIGSKLLKTCLPGSRSKPVAGGHFTPHNVRAQSRMKLFRGMCYGSVSGILSAHSLLLAKSAVELLVRTIVDRENQFNRWQSWVILLGMIFLALTQLFYLHRGLKLCSTSVLYPFVFCIYNVIAIMDGLIYFRQLGDLSGLHAGLIALGTVILLAGVLCLSWRLEDIDSHTAVTVAGPTQTGLGPGMAVVEEHDSSSGLLDGREDEESRIGDHAGEREPLLHGTIRSRHFSTFQRTRAPSLPHIPPIDKHEAADLNAASIWAELDDSDYEFADSQARRGSSSSGVRRHGLSRHSTIGPIPQHRRRGNRRSAPGNQSSVWRRASAPLSGLIGSQRRRRAASAQFPSFSSQGINGYGTLEEEIEASQHRPEEQRNTPTAGLLAGPRRTLMGVWQQGRDYFSQWTSPRAGSSTRRIENDGSSSPLLPRADARPPWAQDRREPEEMP